MLREDLLKKLKAEIEDRASECSIEVRLCGGLLKFTPRGVCRRVLLELEQRAFEEFQDAVVINSHGTSELTSKYKGKAVSTLWVLSFLEQYSSEAKEAIEQHQSEESQQQEAEREKASAARPPRVKCKGCGGESKWLTYGPIYGEPKYSYCSVCHGAGYVDA
jgi:hypothetical protein